VFGIITTVIEITGALLIATGVGLCFGLGAGLIAAGILAIAGSFLATRTMEGVAE
jgi:hypothetical protein